MRSINLPNIGIIGAGRIGSALAHEILSHTLGNVFLYDTKFGTSRGLQLDICQSVTLSGMNALGKIQATESIIELADCDFFVITAGKPRSPGQSRDSLLESNVSTIKYLANTLPLQKNPKILVVTNPVDVLTDVYIRESGYEDVMGMAGILDTGRFCSYLSSLLSVSSVDIRSLVIGAHNADMIPLIQHTSIQGIPLTEWIGSRGLPISLVEEAIRKTQNAGTEIMEAFQGTGSAYWGPAMGCFRMLCAIIRDEKRIIPCSVRSKGRYDLPNVCIGLPVIMGSQGVEEILELSLLDKQKEQLMNSALELQEKIQFL